MNKQKTHFFAFVCSLYLLACSSPEPGPYLDLLVVPTADQPQVSGVTAAMDRLINEAQGHPAWEKSISSLLVFMEGQHFSELGVDKLAQDRWLQVLKNEDGRLAKLALEKWHEVNLKDEKGASKTNERVYARLLLALTDNGKSSEFLQRKQLLTEDAVSDYLRKLSDNAYSESASQKSESDPEDSAGQIVTYSQRHLNDDPLLSKTADSYCDDDNKDRWKRWKKGLPSHLVDYWQGLIAMCASDFDTAIEKLEIALEKLKKSHSNEGLAVHAAEQLILAYRSKGDRPGAARVYKTLTLAYEQPKLTAAKIDRSDFTFSYDRINQTLWSARYQALVGDYFTARNHVQKALTALDQALQKVLSQSQRNQLRALKAEAFHIQAHRIAYELEDFEGALSYSLLGLDETRDISAWYARFLWYSGWYQMRLERYPEAMYYWNKLLKSPKSDDYRSQLLFWMADIAGKMDKTAKRDELASTLCQENPFSFYVVVALSEKEWIPEPCQKSLNFHREASVDSLMFESNPFDDGVNLREDPKIANYLYRAELAIKAQIGDLRGVLVRDLYDRVRKNYRLHDNMANYVFIGRLLHAAGLHYHAISLAYELSLANTDIWRDHPSQLHVYFPRPYLNLVQFNAARFEIDPELVLAVGRQESSFRPTVKSHAGAIGLLQLIPPTAERYALKLGIDYQEKQIEDILTIPEYNIALGSAYLSDLRSRYKDQVQLYVAAYNAGEYAVDAWYERRYHSDPLIWIEGIPFSETRKYVKLVMRNLAIYRFLMTETNENYLSNL